MRLLRLNQPEAIKSYAHIKHARAWRGEECCRQRCPGEVYFCTREEGHSGFHVFHRLFRWGRLKGIVAVWGDGVPDNGAADDVEWTLHARQPATEEETSSATDEGMEAFGRGDYAAALRAWLPDAEGGNLHVQTNVAVVYQMMGDHREQSRWLRRAAEQGDSESEYQIGLMYLEGDAFPADEQEAVRWWSKAAAQGHALAQYNLGRMHCYGWGTQQDLTQAYLWFHLAVLGYQEMIDEGFSRARLNRWDANTLLRMTEKRMTAEQMKEAERLVEEWTPKTE